MVCPDPLRGSKFWWKADFSVVSWCFMYHNQLLGCACQHPKVIQKNSCNFMCATIYTYMTNITLTAFIRPFASFCAICIWIVGSFPVTGFHIQELILRVLNGALPADRNRFTESRPTCDPPHQGGFLEFPMN